MCIQLGYVLLQLNNLMETDVSNITVQCQNILPTIQEIQEHCNKKEKIELSRFVSLRASGSCCSGKDSMSCSLDVDLIMAGTAFQATPINAVPIVPSALSKNLSGPVSLSEIQGEPKTGYVFNYKTLIRIYNTN